MPLDGFPDEEFHLIVKETMSSDISLDDIPELMSLILFICSQSTKILDYNDDDTSLVMVITDKDDFSYSDSNMRKLVTVDECKDFIQDKIKFI
jgi:hypothetical protein